MDFTFEDDNRTLPSKTRRRGLSSPKIVESPVSKVSRKKVATSAMEVDFGKPIERHRRKAPGKISYMGAPKPSFTLPKLKFNIVSLVWILFAVLTLRLVFMDRGVLDFYKKEDLIKKSQMQLHQVEQDNISLVEEIEKIKTQPSYQKMLAREHLGVIAKDEYLILFSKEGPSPAI